MNPAVKARPTLYRGIQMRSRLEADFAGSLDASGLSWEYEPECYASGAVQWLPDFRVAHGGRVMLTEVKPASSLPARKSETCYDDDTASRIDKILRRMSVAWDSAPRAWLNLEFWIYQAAHPKLRVLGRNGQPWIAWYTSRPVIWQGMGQTVRPGFEPWPRWRTGSPDAHEDPRRFRAAGRHPSLR